MSNSHSPVNISVPLVSSQLGHKWLESVDDVLPDGDGSQATPVELLVQPAEPNAEPIQSDVAEAEALTMETGTVFISIPEVGMNAGDVFSTLEYSLLKDPDELAAAFSKASDARLHDVTGGSAEPTKSSETQDLARSVKPVEAEHKSSASTRNDLAEPPTEWTDKPPAKETPRTDTGKSSKQSNKNQAIEKLANAIVERFPLGDPTVLLFVGSESNRHIDETCALVSSALAERRIGRILLVDSDAEAHSLSNASGVSGQPGITDVANSGIEWESTIYGRSATGLDFLAAGTGLFHHPESNDRLRRAVAEMKREYQFICISAGDARGPSARIWNDICDGSYLLVSLKNSNQTIAKSAVTEMQTSGARLLGCVVTDVD